MCVCVCQAGGPSFLSPPRLERERERERAKREQAKRLIFSNCEEGQSDGAKPTSDTTDIVRWYLNQSNCIIDKARGLRQEWLGAVVAAVLVSSRSQVTMGGALVIVSLSLASEGDQG